MSRFSDLPFFTLLIHQGAPPALREVMPGRCVNVHFSLQGPYFDPEGDFPDSSMAHTLRECPFDMVCTVGFDFQSLTDHQQRVVRRLAREKAAIIRIDPI